MHITNPPKESYNFYHSQLRITIERTFGIIIRRWGIFWHGIEYDLPFVIDILHACIRLHNFCTDQSLPILESAHRVPPSHVAVDEDGILMDEIWRANAEPSEEMRGPTIKTRGGSNALQDWITDEIKNRNLLHNRNYS